MNPFLEEDETEGQAWWDQALCYGVDPDLFQSLPGWIRADRWGRARPYCQICPVQRHCLEDVLSYGPAYGNVFHLFQGGHTPTELLDLWLERQGQAS